MTKEHLLKVLEKGIRYDGRKLTEYRPIKIETNISKSAEGSAKITIGETELIAGVKLGIETPYPDTPNQGNLMVNVELLPMSNSEFEVGPPGDNAVELARVVDRGIRESKAINTKKLCVKEKEKVWSVMIDICTINAAGGLFDAATLGAIAALQSTTMPKLEETTVNYDEKTKEKLPITRDPITVTVYKIGPYLIVDPLPEEEKEADARLTIALTRENTICALQKGGTEPLTTEIIEQMITIAQEKAPQLRKHLK
ncbi:exosome complex protein Rrp42 [Candidatus Woesearchaeota archaeon]|nr:exosome complex protein Rrp42 [Candidatus Woesearchaeota archaeon]